MRRLRWTAEAVQDREAIWDYISGDDVDAAISIDEMISVKAARLSEHPEMGRIGRVAGTRELVISGTYILIYHLERDVIRVLRVLHAARRWP